MNDLPPQSDAPVKITTRVADEVRRIVFQRSFAHRHCAHASTAWTGPAPAPACAACGTDKSRWVHLRMCLACGAVGCCDSSAARHARAHFEETGHPVIRSIEPGELWAWCYIDRAYISLRGTR